MCLQCQENSIASSGAPGGVDARDDFRLAEIEQQKLGMEGAAVLPVKVTPHYRQLVEREMEILGQAGGPLYCVAYPKPDRFTTKAPGEVSNYVQDEEHMPPGLEDTVIHRYPAKLLFLATDRCIGHCQYCFRPDVVSGDQNNSTYADNLSDDIVERVCEYLSTNPQVQEVILSGGDPLACNAGRLRKAIQRISRVPSVKWLRLHTRAPAYDPSRLSDDFIKLCREHRIRVVAHLVHPYEIGERATQRLTRLREEGVQVYNQFPLVRGINDHAAVIMELAYTCAELDVQILSMFSPDPVRFGASYRVSMERVYDIADEVFRRGEAWISNFRVCQDTPIGKVKREHLVSMDRSRNEIVYRRDGRTVHFPDLPARLDVPTSLDTLLYNGTTYLDLSPWR